MFPGPDSMGFVWGRVGQALIRFIHTFMNALFGNFCYVAGFGYLGDPVLPSLRGASKDADTVYAY